MRSITRILMIVVTMLLCLPSIASGDEEKGSGGHGRATVVPATGAGGNSAGSLIGDWFAQNLALPAARSPFGQTDNVCLDVGRHGRVLSPAGGDIQNGAIEMTCDVRVGRPVVLVMTSADCSTREPIPFFGATAAEQRACVLNVVNNLITIYSINVSVDGARPVDIHKSRFFAVSPQRRTVFSTDPVFGATSGPATFVAAGWTAEIRGMTKGRHTVTSIANIEGQPVTPFKVHFNVVR